MSDIYRTTLYAGRAPVAHEFLVVRLLDSGRQEYKRADGGWTTSASAAVKYVTHTGAICACIGDHFIAEVWPTGRVEYHYE